jgi:SAM-dependent methyltransferase
MGPIITGRPSFVNEKHMVGARVKFLAFGGPRPKNGCLDPLWYRWIELIMSPLSSIEPPREKPRDRQASSVHRYRRRSQDENAQTQEIVINMAHQIDLKGGYILVNELETRSLFSRVDLTDKRVLEVGCGTLPVTLAIPHDQRPKTFVATDVNIRIVKEAARQDSFPNYAVFSALDPALKPGSLDYIVLNGVLHHLPPSANLLGVLQANLKDSGRFLILEPNVSCVPGRIIKWGLKKFFNMSMEASPYGQFSRHTINKLVQRAGLEVEQVWHASLFAFPLTGGGGRVRVVPDSRPLFKILVALDQMASFILNRVPVLNRWLHWRTIYMLKPRRNRTE